MSYDYIAHYGKKGMRWGVRAANKEAKQQHKEERNREIEADRQRFKTFGVPILKQAKAQYQIDKKTIGKREAKKILANTKSQLVKEFETAAASKAGKETTVAILGAVGAIVVVGAILSKLPQDR